MKNDNQAHCKINEDQSITMMGTDIEVARMVSAMLWHLVKEGWPVASLQQYMVTMLRLMGDSTAASGFSDEFVAKWSMDALMTIRKDYADILEEGEAIN